MTQNTLTRFNFTARGNFIGGTWSVPSEPSGHWVSRSPAQLSDELGNIVYSYASVDQAVTVAREAFKSWRKTPLAERVEILKRYKAAIAKREAELMECIAREVGKPLWETKTEITAMLNKVDITINESMKLVETKTIPGIMEKTQGVIRHKPLGVMAVIGPFNFPGHLPNGHFVPALLTGNTVIFKPSEKSPITGQIIAECFEEAGIPRGVFNLIQGEKEVGRRLCVHEGVAGVLFTGSYEVGLRIKQDTLAQHWKLLALEMGGKNASIVCADADMDHTLAEIFTSAFITAGQRCSATSRILIHESKRDEFVTKLHAKAKDFKIGHPLEDPYMGPLIDSGAVDRYLKFLGIAVREGFEMIMRGKALELKWNGNYVTPSICVAKDNSVAAAKKGVYQQSELFAPNVAIVSFSDIEHAIELANCTQYGLITSVFTGARATYEKCVEDLEMGLVNWNKSTVGASSKLPFGGVKKSGNHFPTALTSTLYCTVPVSSLEMEN